MKRILLVDDDQAVLRLVQDMLSGSIYTVVALSRFQAAKDYLSLNVPDVIITDVRLGDFNGLHLVILAKRLNPAIRAIVMTGHDDAVIRNEAERLGAPYLVKPFQAQDLAKFIEE